MLHLPLVPDASGRFHFHAVLHALIDRVRRRRYRCGGTAPPPPPPHPLAQASEAPPLGDFTHEIVVEGVVAAGEGVSGLTAAASAMRSIGAGVVKTMRRVSGAGAKQKPAVRATLHDHASAVTIQMAWRRWRRHATKVGGGPVKRRGGAGSRAGSAASASSAGPPAPVPARPRVSHGGGSAASPAQSPAPHPTRVPDAPSPVQHSISGDGRASGAASRLSRGGSPAHAQSAIQVIHHQPAYPRGPDAAPAAPSPVHHSVSGEPLGGGPAGGRTSAGGRHSRVSQVAALHAIPVATGFGGAPRRPSDAAASRLV